MLAVPKLRPRRANIPKLQPKDITDQVYDSNRWQELSRWLRRQRPVCERCQEALSEHVHHIRPIRVAPHLAYAVANLQCLCRACHEAVHRGHTPPVSEGGEVSCSPYNEQKL